MHCSVSNSTNSIIEPSTTIKSGRLECVFIQPKQLTFEKEMGLSSKPQIKSLLSRKIERPNNLHIHIMKYEFSNPSIPPF